MDWVYWCFVGLGALAALVVLIAIAFQIYIDVKYIPVVKRIFQEMPPFKMPLADPMDGAEEVVVASTEGVSLQGCYLRTPKVRRGVLLFGIEFQSNCWSCHHYVDFLLEAGYDVFAVEMRGQGKSPAQAGYVPLQWVTQFEVNDYKAAVAYLKNRPDKSPQGIGFFGLSKGASAGLVVAASDPFIKCCVTDGAFATLNTMVPYMKHFINIYTSTPLLARILPNWYYRFAALIAINRVGRERKVRYSHLEGFLRKLSPRPWLIIHGGGDKYIKPDMARSLWAMAGPPKDLWIVEKAKHNQALATAGDEYRRRVLAFFEKYLGDSPVDPTPAAERQLGESKV